MIALTLAAALGVYAFGTLRNMAQTPLGPSLPFIPKSLPPTWTASPGPAPTQMGQVALVPTVSFPTSTPGPLRRAAIDECTCYWHRHPRR
ncbi:MAG: hypothetical protein IPJ47_07015 [Anaerolineales bacterium]|nr:hypothetical protein [Anaerolineales bacterium]